MDNQFNNYFQQQIWNSSLTSKNLLHPQQQNVSSTDKTATASSSSTPHAAPNISAVAAKLASQQPPHSTNRDLTSLSLDNRLYLESLSRQQQQQLQQQQLAQQQSQHRPGVTTFGSLSIHSSSSSGNRDSNNNSNLNMLSSPNLSYPNQKLLSRLDIDTIRSNINSQRSMASCSSNEHRNLIHHQHGTILFNTLNGGTVMGSSNNCNSNLLSGASSGSTAECFAIEGQTADSTTPPPPSTTINPSAIMPPPPPSSASSTSSTISTNLGINLNSSGSSNSNETEKVKTPNSIRGESS